MKLSLIDTAKLFIGNGYGVGKSNKRYLFAKHANTGYALSLGEEDAEILSEADPENLEERKPIARLQEIDKESLSPYFTLDEGKRSNIDWLGTTVNFLLIVPESELQKLKNYVLYCTWPALDIAFVDIPTKNTIITFDRTCSPELRKKIEDEISAKGLESNTEIWSMTKLFTMADRFGELAPEMCMEVVLRLASKNHGKQASDSTE